MKNNSRFCEANVCAMAFSTNIPSLIPMLSYKIALISFATAVVTKSTSSMRQYRHGFNKFRFSDRHQINILCNIGMYPSDGANRALVGYGGGIKNKLLCWRCTLISCDG